MDDCLFCKIAASEIPCTKVFEDDAVLAFRDISPQAPVHVLIIPKTHYQTMDAMSADDSALTAKLMTAACEIARMEGIAENGYRLVVNTGTDGAQSVGHVHVHLLGGRQMGWPPG